MGSGLVAGRRVVVEVPATVANLGAGFDCLGIAVDLALRVEVSVETREAAGDATRLTIEGEGHGEIPAGRGNRFLEALEAGLAERGLVIGPDLTWHVSMANAIPLARGLGSSGAATVAGLLAAEALAADVPAADIPTADPLAAAPPADRAQLDRLIAAASRLEGHPDNVAPAILGGLVATLVTDAGVAAYRFAPPTGLRVALFVPDRRTETSAMRAILPPTVPRTDAVATVGRASVAMAGVGAGDWTALRLLANDRLHEPYRAAAYPELVALVDAATSAGALLACLAGAGSSIAAFTLEGDREAETIARAMRTAAGAGLPGRSLIVAARDAGARVVAPGRGSSATAPSATRRRSRSADRCAPG